MHKRAMGKLENFFKKNQLKNENTKYDGKKRSEKISN